MNLVENYIEEVYSVDDVTDVFKKMTGKLPKERMLSVEMRVSCYGHVEDVSRVFYKTEWEKAQKDGYYMA